MPLVMLPWRDSEVAADLFYRNAGKECLPMVVQRHA